MISSLAGQVANASVNLTVDHTKLAKNYYALAVLVWQVAFYSLPLDLLIYSYKLIPDFLTGPDTLLVTMLIMLALTMSFTIIHQRAVRAPTHISSYGFRIKQEHLLAILICSFAGFLVIQLSILMDAGKYLGALQTLVIVGISIFTIIRSARQSTLSLEQQQFWQLLIAALLPIISLRLMLIATALYFSTINEPTWLTLAYLAGGLLLYSFTPQTTDYLAQCRYCTTRVLRTPFNENCCKACSDLRLPRSNKREIVKPGWLPQILALLTGSKPRI